MGGEGEVRGIAKKKIKRTGLISFVWFLGSANIHLDLDMVYEQKESRWREKHKKTQQGKKKNQQNVRKESTDREERLIILCCQAVAVKIYKTITDWDQQSSSHSFCQ